MTHSIGDRVKEMASTTGTGAFTLAGAVAGFRTFASTLTADGDTTWYCAVNSSEWEIGLGTRTSASSLARTSVLASSNNGAAVSFSAAPSVFCTIPASQVNSAGDASFGTVVNSSQAISSTPTKIVMQSKEFDTLGNFDLVNSRFVAPVSGVYSFTAVVSWVPTLTGQVTLALFRNGTAKMTVCQAESGANRTTAVGVLSLSAGDFVELFMTAGTATVANSTRFQGFLIPGSAITLNAPNVGGYAAFNAVNDTALGAQGPLAANTNTKCLISGAKEYDPDNVFDSTNSRLIVPVTGVYEFVLRVARNNGNTSLNINSQLAIFKNGVIYAGVTVAGNWTVLNIPVEGKFAAGDIVEMYFNPGADTATSLSGARLTGKLVRAL